jgi:hypothetical protein
MNPEPVSGLQIWHLGDWQGGTGALHTDFNFWADQIEGSVIGAGWTSKSQADEETKKRRFTNTTENIEDNTREAHYSLSQSGFRKAQQPVPLF